MYQTRVTSFFVLQFTFYSCTEQKETLPDPLEAGWKGKPVCEVLENHKELRVLKCTFPPNVGHELHFHNPHFGYLFSGSKFRITNSEDSREVYVKRLHF